VARLSFLSPMAAESEQIQIRGAREHNLKNVSLDIPKRKLVVFHRRVGLRGKSSLAFDTLYAEGQRRYVESLSSYARQFLGQMEKPRFDTIRGLSPAISIEQKAASNNPRSTVGTITEVTTTCACSTPRSACSTARTVAPRSASRPPSRSWRRFLRLPAGSRLLLLAPVVRDRKGETRTCWRTR